MSKLRQLSVSDSFTSASNNPRNPNEPHWKQMLFQLGLVIAGSAILGIIIHYSNQKIIRGIVVKAGKANQGYETNPIITQSHLPSPTKEDKDPITTEADQMNNT